MKRTILIALVSLGLLACTPAATDDASQNENALDAENAAGDTAEATSDAGARSAGGGTGLGVPEFPDDAPEPAPTVTVPGGTEIVVVISSTLSASESSANDTFQGTLAESILVDGTTALPRGSTVHGRVVSARESGRVQGVARIELILSSIEIGGRTYDLSSAPFSAEAATERTEDAQRIGVGAGLGALIGAAIGGGDGAALGAAIGGGAGTAVVLTDRGDDVVLPAETPLLFILDEPVSVAR